MKINDKRMVLYVIYLLLYVSATVLFIVAVSDTMGEVVMLSVALLAGMLARQWWDSK